MAWPSTRSKCVQIFTSFFLNVFYVLILFRQTSTNPAYFRPHMCMCIEHARHFSPNPRSSECSNTLNMLYMGLLIVVDNDCSQNTTTTTTTITVGVWVQSVFFLYALSFFGHYRWAFMGFRRKTNMRSGCWSNGIRIFSSNQFQFLARHSFAQVDHKCDVIEKSNETDLSWLFFIRCTTSGDGLCVCFMCQLKSIEFSFVCLEWVWF